MNIDPREFSELTRKATELMASTADVPILLRSRFGEQHGLCRSAEEMMASIETFVRELRSFDATNAPAVMDIYGEP